MDDTPTTTIRLSAENDKKLREFCREHLWTQTLVIKRALKLFWEAITKGEIKP